METKDKIVYGLLKGLQTVLAVFKFKDGEIDIDLGDDSNYEDDKEFILDLKKRTDSYLNTKWRKQNDRN